jgi:DNA-binding CsgD family transcriptional regulator
MVATRVPAGDGPEPGAVWLDADGGIVFASPAAQRWLDLLDAQSHAGFARSLLAGLAIHTARGHAREPAADRSADRRALAIRVRSGDGRWVRARAENVTVDGGGTPAVAVVIDAVRAGDVLPLAASAYRLTDRELGVVRGVLNGLDTRSVAASLHISEYTVQDHLKSVFAKAGVRSRRELAHQFAVQFGWPGQQGQQGQPGQPGPTGSRFPRFLGWLPRGRRPRMCP